VTVEQEGMRRWLALSSAAPGRAAFERAQRMRGDFIELVRKHREELAALYRSDQSPETKRARKAEILRALAEEYRRIKQDTWAGYAGYDPWFLRTPNNAQLASVAIYSQMVPAFQALLRQEGGDLPRFYRAARELAALPREDRDARLAQLAPRLARDQ
jgi:predicted aminopeptidase